MTDKDKVRVVMAQQTGPSGKKRLQVPGSSPCVTSRQSLSAVSLDNPVTLLGLDL